MRLTAKKCLTVVFAASLLAGCVQMVSVNRMMSVPPRPADCDLALVQADMMELSPMGTKWDYLGTVTIAANQTVDSASEQARALIRPKACELGGTSVALMTSMSNSGGMGFARGGAVVFAVLRPKTAPAAPTKF